eukprot:GHVP01046762.1.p1 GENE.GHVP01046762.1~~GHVP01046762.1.p1  ORF type:complete len:128 (-),score=23.47 GHVP01046762.1:356-739(-)
MLSTGERIKVSINHKDAKAPTKGSKEAAGYDLYCLGEYIAPAKGKVTVSTGISISVPSGYCARIAPRSGLAAKNAIGIGNGFVDRSREKDLKVVVFNHGDADFLIEAGSRFAQLVIEKITIPQIILS